MNSTDADRVEAGADLAEAVALIRLIHGWAEVAEHPDTRARFASVVGAIRRETTTYLEGRDE